MKFKKGDKVRCVKILNSEQESIVIGGIYTVYCQIGTSLEIANLPSRWSMCQFEICTQQTLRDDLQAAMELLENYGIGATTTRAGSGNLLDYYWYTSGKGNHSSIGKVLDFHLPLKTPEQIEIERIEDEMRVLADSLSKLKHK